MNRNIKLLIATALTINVGIGAILIAPSRIEYASIHVPAHLSSHTSSIIQSLGNVGWEIHSKQNYARRFYTYAAVENGVRVETWEEELGRKDPRRLKYKNVESVLFSEREEQMVQFNLTRKVGLIPGRSANLPPIEGVHFTQASAADFK